MKNKAAVISIAAIITVLCLFYLSFTFVSRGITSNMFSYAQEQVDNGLSENPNIDADSLRKASLKYFKDSLWNEKVYLDYTYAEVKRYELNLGLDLQGGMHITLIVSPVEIMKGLSGNNSDEDFVASINEARRQQRTDQRRFTAIFYDKFVARKGEGRLWEVFLNADNQERVTAKSTDKEIIAMIDEELDDAIDRSLIVLRSRIDKFGATQPVIQPVKATGRIEIQLPGVDDEERILNQIKSVAKLEFLEVWEQNEIYPYYEAINSYLTAQRQLNKNSDKASETTTTEDQTPEANEEESDDKGLFAEGDDDAEKSDSTLNAENAYPVMDYILADQTGFYAKLSDYDKVNALFATEDVKALLPANMMLMWGIETKNNNKSNEGGIVPIYFVKRGENYPPQLTGEAIVNAFQDYDQRGRVAVSMQMNAEGARVWENMTRENTGKRIAVTLDNIVYSAPNVNEAIPNGSSIISGNFSAEEAKDLANILKAGKLPAPTEIERMVVVGPSLGQEAVDRGLLSLVAGLVLIILFMVLYYAKAGLVANVALLFNIFFILGILSSPEFGAALTLPGIAGIVLTMGMAIDANVLIFERIREEQRLGKTMDIAISNGFNKALISIVDSNATTLITAIILFVFGTGLVKGFATTLMIGIICSFFSAVFITRLIIEAMARNKNKTISFGSAFTTNFLSNSNFDFIGKRKGAYVLSALIIVLGIGAMVAKGGLNLGVAFKGGHSYIVRFDADVVASDVKSELRSGFGEAGTEVKTFDGNNQLQITTSYLNDSEEEKVDELVKAALMQGLSKYNDLNPSILQTTAVGPTIADDIKKTSIVSIIVSLVMIFIYIIIRFRKIAFGLGALVALFHDVFIVLSLFSIASLVGISYEIDEVVIAAFLTLVGYSINDTVVVFDRVREFINDNPKGELGETINRSINSTMSRTIMTSLTTLLVVLILFVFGGEALRGFSFALLTGVIVGTYSSIFIATPVVLDSQKKSKEQKDAIKPQATVKA